MPRPIRPDGFDADEYEAMLDRGCDPMEIEDLLLREDERVAMYGTDDFDDPEEEIESAPPPAVKLP